MLFRSLLQYLARWGGGGGAEQGKRKVTVTRGALPRSAGSALEEYRSALKLLEAQGGAKYRAGALEQAQKAL